MIIIETARIVLRQMEQSDLDNLLRIYADPNVMQYYPSTLNRTETIQLIHWHIASYPKNGFGLWIAEMKDSRQFVGQCGFITQELEGQAEVEMGYAFVRQCWGQGLATEATLACKHYGFHQLGLKRLISVIDAENIASQRVAEKNGMTVEREIMKWKRPSYVYSIVKGD